MEGRNGYVRRRNVNGKHGERGINDTRRNGANRMAKIVPKQLDKVIIIGLDIGYGMTKAIAEGIDDPVIFPSVWGHAREIKFRASEIAQKYPGDQITDEYGSWFIGDLAMSQLPTGGLLVARGRTGDEELTGNEHRVRLALVAIGKLFPGKRNGDVVHVRIATGLPVDHMRDAAGLKKALIGQHHIKTDQGDFVVNVVEVIVMPQPYGTVYANMLTENGDLNPCHTATRTGVADVGTYTIDVALDDDGEYIDVESGSREFGVAFAQDEIAALFEREHRQKPRYKQIQTILQTGCAKVGGEVYDYSDEVENVLAPLREATLTLMHEKWQAGKTVDVIYISGGGAVLVEKAVKGEYRQATTVPNAQLANARGYLNYALFSGK